jgi:putative ABC transport system substrate-binding protein
LLDNANWQMIIGLAESERIPAIYGSRRMVTNGGLLYYSSDWVELYRRAASYVDQMLKGVKPADLPVQQPTKYYLAINLKTAKAMGIAAIPSCRPQIMLIAFFAEPSLRTCRFKQHKNLSW